MLGLQVLKAFLTARQGYILQCLAAATGTGAETDLDSLACILADVATMVRPLACLAFQGMLFGGNKPWQAPHQCMCVANTIASTMCWPDHYGRNRRPFSTPNNGVIVIFCPSARPQTGVRYSCAVRRAVPAAAGREHITTAEPRAGQRGHGLCRPAF